MTTNPADTDDATLPPVEAHPVVYQCDINRKVDDDPVSHAAVKGFLEAHGINPSAIVHGNQLKVRRRPDGTFYVDVWRAVGNVDGLSAPYCPHCPGCIRQERVAVPLVAPVPVFGGVFLTRSGPPPSEVVGPVTVRPMTRVDGRAAEFLQLLADVDRYDIPPGMQS